MKKVFRVIVLFLVIGPLLILGGCVLLGRYYQGNFPVNTWINGIYCTGKTVEQVNEELSRQAEVPEVTIIDAEGTSWQLDLWAADGRADFTAGLNSYLRKNASAFWIDKLQESASAELEADSYKWNREKLLAGFEALGLVKAARERSQGVTIEYTENGYSLVDGNAARLDVPRAFAYLEECLSAGQTYVNLVEGGCYSDLEDSRLDVMQRDVWSQLQTFFDCRIVYDMGAEQIPLTSDITSAFLAQETEGVLALDETGHIMLDEESVRTWVEELAQAYNTVGTTLEFQATRGDVVSVEYDTYGTELDVETEVAWLIQALTESRQETEYHIPAYLQEGFARGLNDIGGTYIEVDMTEQHMYYYVDWELVLDTDIVTGNLSTRHGTPSGVNFVYAKARNRILRGPGYASPVKYWMPTRGNVGIHDADWRSTFGGEIYKTDGSHGCINTPPELMPKLYEMVEIGTPVLTFY